MTDRYLSETSRETEVWVADAPPYMIYFNGLRFLSPYSAAEAIEEIP